MKWSVGLCPAAQNRVLTPVHLPAPTTPVPLVNCAQRAVKPILMGRDCIAQAQSGEMWMVTSLSRTQM